VTPVTSGYRLVLTYNLTVDPQSILPSAETGKHAPQELHNLLQQWRSTLQRGGYLIHLLDHEYTEQSLRLRSLKGRDLNVSRALIEAGNATGFVCSLASCKSEMTYAVDESRYFDDGYAYGEEDSDTGSVESEDTDEDKNGKAEKSGEDKQSFEKDVINDSVVLERIVDLNGELLAKNILVGTSDFLVDNLFDRTPDDEEESGYTGNEGATATQWYRDTVSLLDRCVDFC
jgi:cobalamin biosynthesis protein CobT